MHNPIVEVMKIKRSKNMVHDLRSLQSTIAMNEIVFPNNSCAKALTHNVMVFRKEVFGEIIGLDDIKKVRPS